MIQFAAARWNSPNVPAGERAQRVLVDLARTQEQVTVAVDEPGWLLVTWGEPSPGRLLRSRSGRRFVIGTVFSAFGRDAGSPIDRSIDEGAFEKFCRSLCREHWGAYVALSAEGNGDTISIFRDPIGRLDCVTWAHEGLRIVTSHAPACSSGFPPTGFGFDWNQVRRGLWSPETIADGMMLGGICDVRAGAMTTFENRCRTDVQLWRASHFCPPAPPPLDAKRLSAIVRECVSAWQAARPGAIAEVSGGFDSAIVVANMAKQSPGLLSGFNYYTTNAAGDERSFARAIAKHLDLPVVEVVMPVRAISTTDLHALPIGNRPSIGAVDIFHDRDLAQRASAIGATALFTGQGGDAIFFQHPAVELAGETEGSTVEQFRQLLALASWTQQSIWSLGLRRLRSALRIAPVVSPQRPSFYVQPESSLQDPMPWAGSLERLSATKRMHVEALALSRLAFGYSWTSEKMAVVHALMSQPIIEAVLATPVMALTEGRRDRAMARRAFAADLPISVVDRRGKGSLTGFFGQCMVRSLPFLKEYLLDGLVSESGAIERGELERHLAEDYLMQVDVYPELIQLTLLEYWLRGWQNLLV